MRRVYQRLALTFVVSVILGSHAVEAFALSVTVPHVSTRRGLRIVVPVEIGDVSGSALISCDLTVVYDATLVTAIGIVTNETLSQRWTTALNNQSGELRVALANSEPVTMAGTFFGVEFQVGDHHGRTDVTLRNVSLNEGHISGTIHSGAIVVANGRPVAHPHSFMATEGLPTMATLTASDPDDDPLTYVVTSEPQFGVLTGEPPNLIYTPIRQPTVGFVATDTFSFRVNDGFEDSEPVSVSVEIVSVNDPPTATVSPVRTDEDTPVGIRLEATDPDGDAMTFALVESPRFGVLEGVSPNLTYRPNLNANGIDRFSFVADDGLTTSDPVAAEITINAVDDPPTFRLDTSVEIVNDGTEHRIPITGVSTGGVDEASQSVAFSAFTDNTVLVADVRVEGEGAERTLIVTLADNAFGTASVTVVATESGPSSTGQQATATLSLTAHLPAPTIRSAVVTPTTPRNPGTSVTVTAEVREATEVRFSIDGVPAAQNVLMEPEGRAEPHGFRRYRGTYRVTVSDPPVVDAVVTVRAVNGEGASTDFVADGTVTIRSRRRAWVCRAEPATIRPGGSLTLTFEGDDGLSVTADVSAMEPAARSVSLTGLKGSSGVYVGRYTVPTRLKADDGVKEIVFLVELEDKSVETLTASVNLETGRGPYRERIAAVERSLSAIIATGVELTAVSSVRAALERASNALDDGDLSEASTQVSTAERLVRTERLEADTVTRLKAVELEYESLLNEMESKGMDAPSGGVEKVTAALSRVREAIRRADYHHALSLCDEAEAAVDAFRSIVRLPRTREEEVEDTRESLRSAKAASEEALASVVAILGSLDSDALTSALEEVRHVSSRTSTYAERSASLDELAADARDAFASAYEVANTVAKASERLVEEANRSADALRFVFDSDDVDARRNTASTFEKRVDDARLSVEVAQWAAENAQRLADAAERASDPSAEEWRTVAKEAERAVVRAAIGVVVFLAENASMFAGTDALECKRLSEEAATQPTKDAQKTARNAAETSDNALERLREAEREYENASKQADEADDEEARTRRDQAKEFLDRARREVDNAVSAAKQAGKSATDLDGDGKNDLNDLTRVAVVFGDASEGLSADVNDDGLVDILDLVYAALGTSAAGVLIRNSSPGRSAAPNALVAHVTARIEWLSSDEAIVIISVKGASGWLALRFAEPSSRTGVRILEATVGAFWRPGSFVGVPITSADGGASSYAVASLSDHGVTGSGELIRLRLRFDRTGDPMDFFRSSTLTVCDERGVATNVTLAADDAVSPKTPNPYRFALYANYPNPFNPETWIPFELDATSRVTVDILDARGSLVRRLDLGIRSVGVYTSKSRAAYWDGRNEQGEIVASGVYYVVVRTRTSTATRSIVLRK
jgi:hypothetical protein